MDSKANCSIQGRLYRQEFHRQLEDWSCIVLHNIDIKQLILSSCALIHRHRPDLLDYLNLNKSDAKTNMNLAFDIAEEHLGIPKLIAADDILNVEKVLQLSFNNHDTILAR